MNVAILEDDRLSKKLISNIIFILLDTIPILWSIIRIGITTIPIMTITIIILPIINITLTRIHTNNSILDTIIIPIPIGDIIINFF